MLRKRSYDLLLTAYVWRNGCNKRGWWPTPHSANTVVLLLCCALLLCLQASPPDVWSQLRQLCLQDRRGAAALAGNLQESSSWEDSSEESDDADDGSSM